MAPTTPTDFLNYDELSGLLRNLRDPEEIVQIASMRAIVRLAEMQSPKLRAQIHELVETEFPRYRKEDIVGVSFLPAQSIRRQISRVLDSLDEQGRDRARLVLSRTTELVEFQRHIYGEVETEQERWATELVLDVICAPRDRLFLTSTVPEAALLHVGSTLASHLVTSLFARLAMLDYDDRSEWHLAESENISRQVYVLDSRFEPDVPALFQIYRSLFRHSMQFWLRWLEEMKDQEGLDLVREMPSWFPITQGPLAVTRQIEWTVSRRGMRAVLVGLTSALQSPDAGDRWAAANLIEWSTRYLQEPNFPRFGGGSGPPDLDGELLKTLRRRTFNLTRGYIKQYVGDKVWVLGDGLKELQNLFAEEGANTPQEEHVNELEPDQPEAQRYTDLTIYEEHLFAGDDSSSATRLQDCIPLVAGSPYTLEVAIRLKRTGIDAALDPLHSVKNPRQDKEDLTIYVLAQSLWPGIKIEESFTKVIWPYNSDSESAFFRLEVKPTIQTGVSQGGIEVRVYDGSLDLLDIVQLSIATVSEPSATVAAGIACAATLTWPDKIGGAPHIVPRSRPRLSSIDVGFDSESSKYKFLFKFLTNNNKVAIPGSSLISRGDVENLLVKVRDFWTELVITNYSTELNVTRATFGKYLTQLRDLGIEAWSLLFGTRYAAQAGASETIGELLEGLMPNEGALIQITYSNADDFIFPWSILYSPGPDETPVDPYQFWGARYQIEQVTDGPKSDKLTDEPIDLIFALDPAFANSGLQMQLLKTYETAAKGKLKVSDPISDMDAFFGELIRLPAAHLYYFYCHGYAPAGKSVLNRDGVQLLRKSIEAIPEDSPSKAALVTLLTLTAKMNDEPWIYIGNSEIRESKIKLQEFFKKRRPIIFLNMCQSADLLPSLTSGLVRVFLDHNASAVIGTESPMTGVFANAFSKVFFDELFAGHDVGTALWKARRRFLEDDMRNPLGLAYTLYGRAVARLGKLPIIAAVESPGTTHSEKRL